jgi:multidrug resistance efflux pump
MNSEDRDYRPAAETRFRAETRPPPPPRPYRIPPDYPSSGQPRQAPRDYPPPQAYRQVSLAVPADPPVLLQPARPLAEQRARPLAEPQGQSSQVRRRRTWPQLAGGVLIAGACVGSAVWYVPRVMSDDHRLLTATVSSSGVVALNFTAPGEINKMNVGLDQTVRKGEVLAVEYAPNADSVVAADKAAIAAEQAKMAQIRAAEALNPAAAPADNAELAATKAQLDLDEAQLATDRLKISATEIVAPSSGIIVAANGQPGETVTSSGIRDYVTDSHQASAVQGPQFSLFPEGPQAVSRAGSGGSALPVIALRVSSAWQVVALIPEGSVSGITSGQKVTISVPAARITDVTGQIEEVLPTPISTSEGVFYQGVVTVTGHTANVPMNGMAADVQLGP